MNWFDWSKNNKWVESLGPYIWATISENGAVWPEGRGKDLEYALNCEEANHPDKYKLFKLVAVDHEGQEK